MIYRLFILFYITICIYLGGCATPPGNENEVDNKNPNDTIIELFHNCECTPYYMCSEANLYMFAARSKILPQKLTCSDENFVCCKKTNSTGPDSIPENTTITIKRPEIPTTKPSEVTTEQTSLREKDVCGYSCGIAKTNIQIRILTPDAESASTIPGEVPWMVEIFQKQNSGLHPYRYKCPGTLIHPKVVLTALHCIKSNADQPRSLKVVASGKEVFENVRSEHARNVRKVIKHSQYYQRGLHNDIALLILDAEYNFSNNYLNSICLPKANQSFDGSRCIAAGWGKNLDLKELPLTKVDVPVVDFQRCQSLLRKTKLGSNFNLHSSFMCAGGEVGKDTCKGDGGGPLMCLSEYQFVQAGIVSWGPEGKCGVADLPGIYVNVAQFTEWIQNELKKHNIEIKC